MPPERHHTVFLDPLVPDNTFVPSLSSIDDLSIMSSENKGSQRQTGSVTTGRKSWKTIKGKHRPVWPPMLETCLIEALQKYNMDASPQKSAKGRFPGRNSFISDYIFHNTGKKRTPRQVASRIQQLQVTCKDRNVLNLIANCAYSRSPSTGPPLPTPCSDSPMDVSPLLSPSDPSFVVGEPFFVDIALALPALRILQRPSINFTSQDAPKLQSIYLAPCSASSGNTFYHNSATLAFLSGEVEYISLFPLSLRTTFTVYSGDTTEPIHIEHSFLNFLFYSRSQSASEYHYVTTLVPQFWGKLCSSSAPTQYNIHQTVKLHCPERASSSPRNDTDIIKFVYKFTDTAHNTSDTSNQSIEPLFDSSDHLHTQFYQSGSMPNIHGDSTDWIYNPDTGLPVQTGAFLM